MWRRRALCLLLVGVAILSGVQWWRWLRRPYPPFEVGIWYWRQPFRIAKTDALQLKQMGVRQLFVLAGTFYPDHSRARLQLPQQWRSRADGLDITLVYRFDATLARSFAALDTQPLADSLIAAVRRERTRAMQASLHVVGTQFDCDCPTSRLPKYADLLRRIRAGLGTEADAFSITALPTWYASPNLRLLADAVDFTVPQYYESNIPRTLAHTGTISHLSLMERGLAAAGSAGQPFYAGLPAYGHALLYDEKGQLVEAYHELSLREASRHPAFRLARAWPADRNGERASPQTYIGEDFYDFQAIRPGNDGRGKGYHLVFDAPTPALLAQHLAALRESRPRNCRGAILFAYPEADGLLTLPLPALSAALRGEQARPDLRVEMRAVNAPWEIIETGRESGDRPPQEVTLTITNIGTASTSLAPNAVVVTLALDRPGVDDTARRDFDAVETFFDGALRTDGVPGAPLLRASPARANVLQYRREQLAAGESVKIGPIRLPSGGATRLWGAWQAIGPGGFTTAQGRIATVVLTENRP